MNLLRFWALPTGVLAACGALLMTTAVAAETADVKPADVNAIWQVQEIHFAYQGFTTYYSCDGLRDKVRDVLLELGARKDVLVRTAGCDAISGPARIPSVRIFVANPVEATDAALAARQANDKRTEILARLQRNSKQKFSDEPFTAQRKRIVLSSKETLGSFSSIAGDCELLEQVADDIVPKLGAKVVQNNLHCVPHQGTVGNPKLIVEALVPTVEHE